MRSRVGVRLWGFGVLGLALAGCSASYTVDLTNSTRSTVEARLELESLGSGQKVLARAVVSPGEYRTLGPAEAPLTDRVRLTVTPASGSGGYAERVRLDPGKTFAEVGSDEYGGSALKVAIRREE